MNKTLTSDHSEADENDEHKYLVSDDRILSASDDDSYLDDKKVTKITMEFFYKPRTTITLITLIIFLIVMAFIRDENVSKQDNIFTGFFVVILTFLVLCGIVCPNGPFTRPHPIFWRFTLGLAIIYLLFLCFILFQSFDDVRNILQVFDHTIADAKPDNKVYQVDCDKFSKFLESFDIFFFSHLLGNAGKALIIRHSGILWLLSISWEVTELAFIHLLPNFAECWWDSLILDVLFANAIGIYLGLYVCKKLEMREYSWESFRALKGSKKKLKRVLLQFTPEKWSESSWMSTNSPYKRYIQLCVLIIIFQTNELNTFFLKHIFIIPTESKLVSGRILFILLIVAPAIRQFYMYISDSRIKRLGVYLWVFLGITAVESLVCIKHGLSLFQNINVKNLILWLIYQFLVCFLVLAIMISRSLRSSKNSNSGRKSNSFISHYFKCFKKKNE